jgi:hypothetical protein
MSVLSKEEQVQLWTLLAKIRQKTIIELGWEKLDPFPRSDPKYL